MPAAPVPPPSRHPGSRTVIREPNIVRTIAAQRDAVAKLAARIRREDMSFAPADPALGEPATSATMASTHVTLVHRSGHNLYCDVAAWMGVSSVLAARLYVADLDVAGPPVTSGEGGEQDLRLQVSMPDSWLVGDAHRLYVQARRVSGADATTLRVLRAWQR